jgi:SAM-dependent methyltransferase
MEHADLYSGTASSAGFWRNDEADSVMQQGNGAAWLALAEAEQARLVGARVVDIGCNMGAFLRFLNDRYAIAEAFGVDPAEAAIEQARALNGHRPIEVVAASRPPAYWHDIDLCFSQEVVYLVDDLAQHAGDVWRLLRPGGSYLAVTSVHRNSDRMVQWHATNAEILRLPPLRALEDYIAPFIGRGFEAAVGWLPVRFVPIANEQLNNAWAALEFWTRTSDKVLFRFTRPTELSP